MTCLLERFTKHEKGSLNCLNSVWNLESNRNLKSITWLFRMELGLYGGGPGGEVQNTLQWNCAEKKGEFCCQLTWNDPRFGPTRDGSKSGEGNVLTRIQSAALNLTWLELICICAYLAWIDWNLLNWVRLVEIKSIEMNWLELIY